MKTMTETEIRVAMTLLDEEGKAWVDAVKLGRFALYCDCGIQGVFDTRDELLASNEFDAAKHSSRGHSLVIRKITDGNILSIKEIALCDVVIEEFFDCYSELYKVFKEFSDGKITEEEILKRLKDWRADNGQTQI